MYKGLKISLMAALVVCLVSSAAYAAIVSTSGNVVEIAPPPSVDFHQLESDTQAFAFDEQQDVTLTTDLPVDATAPGTYDEVGDATLGVIPAGTVVDSHFIHADNLGDSGRRTYEGTVVVDGDILGIQFFGSTLSTGDSLVGAIGTVYPTGKLERGLELGNVDFVIWQVDQRTVTVRLSTAVHVDQVRIITGQPRVEPPPPVGGEGCTPGFWKQPQHFDSWTAPYDPTDLFSDHFENAFPGRTLLQVLSQGGGGLNALGRHTVAALLNAASAGVDSEFTTTEVITAFNNVFPGTRSAYEALKNQFKAENERGCPLS